MKEKDGGIFLKWFVYFYSRQTIPEEKQKGPKKTTLIPNKSRIPVTALI